MIDLKNENGIAVLTIRHGKANALDVELCEGLAKSFQELRGSDARAVVMTGQGRIFSAGVDLLRVSSGGPDYVRKFLPSLHRLYDAVFFHPKPVVAAINGHAIAGGCVLACCGDRRIMARGGGRIGVTELLVGVPFPALAFEIVRFAVPRRHLPEFTYGGATYDNDAALARGWVDEAVETNALLPRAVAAGFCANQEADSPRGQRARGAERDTDRSDRHGDLDRIGRLYPRIRRPHLKEGVASRPRRAGMTL
jgi:enoyl-CoA hydratase